MKYRNLVVVLITKAEITLVEDEIQKSCSRHDKYQKGIPEEIKKEVRKYLWDCIGNQKVFYEV